jgi:hypothetical protein
MISVTASTAVCYRTDNKNLNCCKEKNWLVSTILLRSLWILSIEPKVGENKDLLTKESMTQASNYKKSFM